MNEIEFAGIYIAHVTETENVYKILIEKSEGNGCRRCCKL